MRFSLVVIAALLTGAAVVTFAAGSQGWPKQEGEVCLSTYVPDLEYPVGKVEMYVTRMGKGHFLVVGRSIEGSGDIDPFIGSAEIIQLEDGSSMLRMHATLSFASAATFHGQTVIFEADPRTLIGSFQVAMMSVSKSDGTSTINYLGGFTGKPCE
jgi:hypothetical protein